MESGKLKYKNLEVIQPRITEYKFELLTREQIIPDPPNEVLQNNEKGEGRGDELKRVAVLVISLPDSLIWERGGGGGGLIEDLR